MEESRSPRKKQGQRGFSLIETMVAIGVLTIGLVATAALMSSTVGTTSRSRNMNTAALLASEKLEDLDRFPSNDVNLTPGGSLTADVAGYFDDVQITAGNGAISETTTTAGVSTSYTQQANANMTVTQGAGLPAPTADTQIYDRRWTITANSPVAGAKTINVLVTLKNQGANAPTTFQMSVVHP
jgi:prepilin-type N-terminal cleavage/methylation domain-containing protein